MMTNQESQQVMSNANNKNVHIKDGQRVKFINKDIKHLAQMTQNDCGVACIQMAWIYLFKNLINLNLDELLTQLGVKNFSLWTIDIAHILAIKNVKHMMYTITYGVDESYSSEDFYSKEREFSLEKNRISQLFQNANKLGIQICKQSLTLDFIKAELCKNCVCILLVDANLLNGSNSLSDDDLDNCLEDIRKTEKLKSTTCCYPFVGYKKNEIDDMSQVDVNFDKLIETNLVKKSQNNYLGHFIILIGYDDTRNIFFYRNPSSSKKLSFTSYLNMEIARRSFGTDEDIIFIYP